VPPPLPPPDLKLSHLHQLLDRCKPGHWRLDGLTVMLPDARFMLYLYVRKEASCLPKSKARNRPLRTWLLFENKVPTTVPKADVEEVSNYVAAMQHGLRRLHGGFSLVAATGFAKFTRILLRGGAAQTKTPGEFRRSQNWIEAAAQATLPLCRHHLNR